MEEIRPRNITYLLYDHGSKKLVICGLVVGEQQNGRSEVPMLLHVIYSCDVGTDHNKERWMNRSNKFDIFLPVFLLTKCGVCVFQLAELCAKLWEL